MACTAKRMRLALVLMLLSACINPPCEPEHLDDAPTAGPGEVRHGVALDDQVHGYHANVAATANRVACLTCSSIFYLDHTLAEQRQVDVTLVGSAMLAVTDDTTFVFDRDSGQEADDNGSSRPRHLQLFALSATGHELWRDDFGTGEAWQGGLVPLVIAGPASVVVYGQSQASVFDPATGALRWSTSLGLGDALVPDATGGLFIAGGALLLGPGTAHATLRHLDANGSATWTTTWSASESRPTHGAHVIFEGAARTTDSGYVVIGAFSGALLDLGDRILQGPSSDGNWVVAALDSRGATQWAVAFGNVDNLQRMQIAAAPDGTLIGGEYAGSGAGLGLPDSTNFDDVNAFVARVDSSGAISAHAIGGDGFQTFEALAATNDGSAIVTILNGPDLGRAVLRVGSRTFDDGQRQRIYVLNILP